MSIPNPTPIANTYYIAANIIFDVTTGETKQVLMLVNKPEDATIFAYGAAENYANFIRVRAQKIVWSVEPVKPKFGLPPLITDRYIIKGVQYV
jgi:hypothetical protein